MIKCARNCQPAVPGSFLFRVSVDVPLDAVDDHLERDQVFAALRDDKIRIFLARLNIELVHGLDGGQILVNDGIDAAAALFDIAADAAAQAHVGVTGTAAVKKACELGLIEKGATVVSVVTGNGLKDVANAIKSAGEPINIKPDLDLMVEEFAKRGVTVE